MCLYTAWDAYVFIVYVYVCMCICLYNTIACVPVHTYVYHAHLSKCDLLCNCIPSAPNVSQQFAEQSSV